MRALAIAGVCTGKSCVLQLWHCAEAAAPQGQLHLQLPCPATTTSQELALHGISQTSTMMWFEHVGDLWIVRVAQPVLMRHERAWH